MMYRVMFIYTHSVKSWKTYLYPQTFIISIWEKIQIPFSFFRQVYSTLSIVTLL